MAATSYGYKPDKRTFTQVVGDSDVFKPISPVTGKPVVDEEEDEDEDDKQTRELDAMMGLSEDDYNASDGDLEDVTPLYGDASGDASGDDVLDNMLDDSTTSISAARKPTTVESEDLTGLDIVGDRPSEVNMEDFIPFEPHGGDSSTRPFGELDDDPHGGDRSTRPFGGLDDDPSKPHGGDSSTRPFGGLDDDPSKPHGGDSSTRPFAAPTTPTTLPTLPGDDMVKAMEPKFDKSALLDPTNFARQARIPPETMNNLFKKTHGGKFDPNSKMDRLKMKTMETMIQEDKSLLGLSPTQFALKVYSRK